MVTNGLKTQLQTNVTEFKSCVIDFVVFSYVYVFLSSLKQSRYAQQGGIVVQFPQWHLEIRICNNRSSIPNVNIGEELSKSGRNSGKNRSIKHAIIATSSLVYFCFICMLKILHATLGF